MIQTKSRRVIGFILKLLLGLVIISPILLGLSMSFMSANEFSSIPPNIFPKSLMTINYQKALSTVPLIKFTLNSFTVCAIVIIGQIITCSLAAFSFSFFEFKGRNQLFLCVLATTMIPLDSIIISNFLTISSWGLKNSYVGLVLPYLTSAMGIFLMRQYFLTIPKDLQEASILDGCSNMKFLFSIVIPISKPAIASLGVYVFIQTYNQFLWPLLVTDVQEMRTVQIGMSILKMSEAVDYGVVLAGSMMILLPAVIVFVIGQKFLVQGMTAGAVKG